MDACPTCGQSIPAKTQSWSGTLEPLASLSEMLNEIADSVVDQYTPPVSLR